MSIQLTLALRYLLGRRQRTLLSTLAVAIGVMLIFGLNGVVPAMIGMMRQNLSASSGQADLTITSQTRGVFDEQQVARVRGVGGVAAASGSLARSLVLSGALALPVHAGAPINTVIVTGLDLASVEQVRPLTMVAGRALQAEDLDGLVITAGLAERSGLAPGSLMRLPTASGVRAFQVVGVALTEPSSGAEPVYMPLAAAQKLFNLDGQINTIDLALAGGADPQVVGAAALARLGAGYKLGGNQVGSELILAMGAGQFIFNLFGTLALLMGGFIIFNTFRTILVERRRDIGMLRALGMTRRMVLGLVVLESLLQGLAGTLLGLLAGYGLVRGTLWLLEPTIRQLMQMEIGGPVFSLESVLVAVGMGLGVTLLSGLFPAIAASRLSPLEAMRPLPDAPTRGDMARRLGVAALLAGGAVIGLASRNPTAALLGVLIFGLALIVAAPALVYPVSRVFGRLVELTFLRGGGLASLGEMAQGNLARQPVRAAVTASAVMIGLAVVLGMTGVIASIRAGIQDFLEHSLASDYLLMPQSLILGGGNIGAQADLLDHIRQIPGVADATSLRLSTARSGAVDIQVVGIDPAAFARLSGLDFGSGDPAQAYTALADGREMIVNSVLAAQMGLRPGDVVELQTAEGLQRYRVAAIGNDMLNAKMSTAYISQAHLQADFHEATDLLIMVNRLPDADAAGVMARLEAAAAAYPAFAVFDGRVWRAALSDDVSLMLDTFFWLLFILALPSLLALINTLGISVLERTREIGMLRAVGATRRQVRRLILAESLLLAAVGSLFGILAGLWLGYALVLVLRVNGFRFAYFFPWSGLLLTVAAGLLLGVIAAWLPARSAARLGLVEALRYE